MTPQPQEICDLFIPILIAGGLICTVLLQFAFGDDQDLF